MGKKTWFNRKKAVRFTLVPGPEENGKPTVTYKAVDNTNSTVSRKDKKKMIQEIGGIDEVLINGKPIEDAEIPAFVLEQIRGRANLVFNEGRQQQPEGDLYDIEDASGESEYEEVDEEDQEWSDCGDEEDDWEEVQEKPQKKAKEQEGEKFEIREEEFPGLKEEEIEVEGETYKLTQQQAKLLNEVIPEDYDKMDFGGLQFKKFNEDGLDMSQRHKYEKYIAGDDPVVIDSFRVETVPPPLQIDNDLRPGQINSNVSLREVEDALNFEGNENPYDEIEDDFFAKMVKAEIQENQSQKIPKKRKEKERVMAKKVEQKPPVIDEEDMDKELDKALNNYDNGLEEKEDHDDDISQEDEEDDFMRPNVRELNYTDFEKRDELMGRDGELDWRCLTQQEKKQYRRTKIIREPYDELRERQIADKMKGKQNISPEELHLKKMVKHITYEEDHVMRRALEKEENEDSSESEIDEESFSDQDDIVSFHQRTSVIASNLTVIQEPPRPKKKKRNEQGEWVEEDASRIKVIPEKRNKNQSKEERKQRKEKLKELKKDRKEQRKDFKDKFSKARKQAGGNNDRPMNKVSMVKIY